MAAAGATAGAVQLVRSAWPGALPLAIERHIGLLLAASIELDHQPWLGGGDGVDTHHCRSCLVRMHRSLHRRLAGTVGWFCLLERRTGRRREQNSCFQATRASLCADGSFGLGPCNAAQSPAAKAGLRVLFGANSTSETSSTASGFMSGRKCINA